MMWAGPASTTLSRMICGLNYLVRDAVNTAVLFLILGAIQHPQILVAVEGNCIPWQSFTGGPFSLEHKDRATLGWMGTIGDVLFIVSQSWG